MRGFGKMLPLRDGARVKYRRWVWSEGGWEDECNTQMVRHIHGILQELRALTAAMRHEESRRHWGTVRRGCTIRPYTYTHNTTMDGRVVVESHFTQTGKPNTRRHWGTTTDHQHHLIISSRRQDDLKQWFSTFINQRHSHCAVHYSKALQCKFIFRI